MIEVTLRVMFSLIVVLLLMWGLARLVRRPLGGRGPAGLAVLTRQGLSRGASVAVVRVDDRALVLGVTEANVTLLAETDLAAFEPAVESPSAPRHAAPDQLGPARRHHPGGGPLAGSVLSAATWTQAVEFLRDRTGRQR